MYTWGIHGWKKTGFEQIRGVGIGDPEFSDLSKNCYRMSRMRCAWLERASNYSTIIAETIGGEFLRIELKHGRQMLTREKSEREKKKSF